MLYGPGLQSAVYFPSNSRVDGWVGTTYFTRFIQNLESINQAAEQPNISLLENLITSSNGLNKALRFEGLDEFHKSKVRFAILKQLKDHEFACLAAKGPGAARPEITAFYETAGKYGISPEEISKRAIEEASSTGVPLSLRYPGRMMQTTHLPNSDGRFNHRSYFF